MNDDNRTTEATGAPGDPEERAFTGHPDHPPREPDQNAGANSELLRDHGGSDGPDRSSGTEDVGEHKSPGEATTLPGYGG